MTQIKFIKNHPSRRFRKGDVVDMPKENVDAWLASGYAVLKDDVGDAEGNLPAPTEVGVESKKSVEPQSKSGKVSKKKKRGKK